MTERRVAVRFSAEVAGYVRAMAEAAGATKKTKSAVDETGKASEQASQKSRTAADVEAKAAQHAAKALGLRYEATGQLVDANGKALTSSQAAAMGIDQFSDAVYLSGREAEEAAEKTRLAGEEAAKAAERQKEAWASIGPVIAAAGAATVAAVGLAVSKYAAFDKAMSSVQASTHESAANMALLREAAIEAGADTAYSAEEAARGIEEMAKAGVSTADILGGGLTGALSLAAAGNLDVGEAAETAASAMTQFKLSGSDIPHIADLLAAGAGKAQGSVHDLGMALNQAGLVASQTGLTIEEATGGLAAFASAGLVGSDAGTSFKTMLQRLNPQSEEAANVMKDLGLSAYDSQGEFIGLAQYAGNLKSALQDMSSEQRNATMQTLFGSDAVRAAAVLYEQGAEGVQGWIDAVNDAGYAAETAAIMQDNLAGDLEKLGGAMDTVFLKSGSGANDALRGLVQTGEDFVDMIGKIPEPVLSTIGVLAGLAGGAAVVAGGFVTLAPRVFETIGHFKVLRAEGGKTYTALSNLSRIAGVASVALVGLEVAKAVHNGMQPATASVEEMTQSLIKLSKQGESLDTVFAGIDFGDSARLSGEINGIGDAMDRLTSTSVGDSLERFGADVLRADNGMAKLRATFAATDTAMSNFASSGNLDIAASGFRDAAEAAEANGKSVAEAAAYFPEYINSLRDMASTAEVALDEQDLLNWAMGETPPAMLAAAASSEETAAAIGEVGAEAEDTAMSLEDIVEALFLLGEINMSSRDSTAKFHDALRAMNDATVAAKEGTLGLGAVLNEAATDFDLTTEAGMAANSAFQEVARAGMADVEAKAREGMGQPELQANLRGTYDSLITALGGMDITGAAAETLARKVLGVPDNVDIDTWMSDAALRLAQDTGSELDKLDGRRINIYETTHKEIVMTERNERVGVGQVGRYAVGGAVMGPGTATSDSIPALLSNGEHVLDAHDVRAMGGQSAVYQFRDQLKAGVPGYAAGGSVGREYSAPAFSSAGSAGARVEKHYHTHVNAGPGLEQSYSQTIASKAVQRQQDIHAAYGI